jgi:hypothetical protein
MLGSFVVTAAPIGTQTRGKTMRFHVRTTLLSMALLCTTVLMASSAGAVPAGLRGGFSSDPDQFLFGLQVDPPPIAENIHIVPSVEAGLGDDAFSLSFNGDFQYRFNTSGGVRPYAGMGVALWWVDFDNEGFGDDSFTEFGVNALGGVFFGGSGPPMFLELKLGLTDEIPDLKFIFGVNFL